MNIKKIIALAVLVFVFGTECAAAQDVSVNINGAPLFCDVSPIIKNDRVLVPLRAIFEALGCDVSYNEEFDGAYVYALKGTDLIVHKIGSDSLFVNGDTVSADVSSEVISGKTMVPLRAVSEALGCSVEWDAANLAVYIKN